MKNVKSMLLTLFCTCAILIVGYVGIIFFGEKVMKSSDQPELVTMDGNIASLFYSKLKGDVEFFPWNYYIPGKEKDNENCGVFTSDSPYLKEDVFYELIAKATGAKKKRVNKKYSKRERNITESMVQGEQNGQLTDVYFYMGHIRLKKKRHTVKIACDNQSIISFSCIPIVQGGMTSVEDWKEKKEAFLAELEEKSEEFLNIFEETYNTFYAEARGEEKLDMKRLKEEENPIQVIELKNSILLVIEADITMGLYYDVLGKRVTGFHFFYE